jgi:ubiquinone/menaquinone biosynthesis C-methylase UbiE
LNREAAGRRFARFATDVAVRQPWAWRLLRPLVRFEFDRLAPSWDSRRSTEPSPYEAALERIDAPRRALDLGTGTGRYAIEIARRFPEADVVGADLSEQMLGEAWSNLPDDLRDRVRFERADASKLPYEEGEFDLVGLGNMIPFFDELERVTARAGSIVIAFSQGSRTPIYVPFDRLRSELEPRGFTDFAEISAGPGTALVARKQKRA